MAGRNTPTFNWVLGICSHGLQVKKEYLYSFKISDDNSSEDSDEEQASTSERLEVNKQPVNFASGKNDPNRLEYVQ